MVMITLNSSTKKILVAVIVVVIVVAIVIGLLYHFGIIHSLKEPFTFIQLPDFGSTRNYLPSPEDVMGATGIPSGENPLPIVAATDPSIQEAIRLQPQLDGLNGKVIGKVTQTKIVLNTPASTTQSNPLNSDPDVKNITKLFLAALNSQQITTGAPNWTLLSQGTTTLQTTIGTSTGIQKLYKLDMFLYAKLTNFVSHLAVTILSDEQSGNITIQSITFPDITVAQSMRITPADVMQSSVAGPNASPALLNMGSYNPYAATAEIQPVPPLAEFPAVIFSGFPAMCFGSMDVTATTEQQCKGYGGVWDSPVTSDTYCPYFQANKNYDNVFGGANIGGYCQLPSGMQLTGYRHASTSPTSVPLCYNCHGIHDENGNTSGPCCSDQAINKTLYPSLKSPDYKFPGDQAARIAGASQLSVLGLSVR